MGNLAPGWILMKGRQRIVALCTGLLCAAGSPVFASAQDTAGVGAIVGTVVDDRGQPVLAVTVCITGTTRCVLSDDVGRFKLPDVRAATYQIEITPPGQPPITGTTVEVRAGRESVVEITLPKLGAIQQTVTVTGSAFVAPEEVKTSSFLIQSADILSGAGALQDVSRYLQTLPGVVIGTDDFRNDIIVRGGSPLENLFVVDNIEIPNINSFANFASAGGTVSILDAALIQDVTFLTGGYPAPFINRVSSVLQIAQREGNRERFAGRATLGFAGAGTILEGPIAGGKGSWVVSARRSFLDLFTEDLGFGGVPVLYTFSGKVLLDVTETDRIWAVNITGVDKIRLGLTESNLEDDVSDFDIRYRGSRSATGVNWQRTFGQRGVGLLGVSHSEARLTSTVKDLIRDGLPPADAPVDDVIASGPLVFRDRSREGETTIKYDLTAYMPMIGKLQMGGSLKRFGLDYDTASPLGDDSPFSEVRGVNAFALRETDTAYQTGAHLQATRDVTRRLNLTVGGRVDRYGYIDAARFSPRAGASYRLTDALSWRSSYGVYYQQPLFLFLAAFPENRSLLPLRADHYVTGLSYTPRDDARLTVEIYQKRYSDYPVGRQFPSLSLANVGDTFDVRSILFPLVSAGRGRAEGLEATFEKRLTSQWSAQVNVALSRARHAGLDNVLRPGSFDYPFVFNAAGTWKPARGWQASARLAWLAGRPFTPFDTAASSEQQRGIYDLSMVNAARASDYFRLDVRAERTFAFERRPLIIFGGVQNVTNRRNFASYYWNRRLDSATFQEQLGLFPLVGLEWRF